MDLLLMQTPLKGVDHADAEKVTGIFAPAKSGTPPDSWMYR